MQIFCLLLLLLINKYLKIAFKKQNVYILLLFKNKVDEISHCILL